MQKRVMFFMLLVVLLIASCVPKNNVQNHELQSSIVLNNTDNSFQNNSIENSQQNNPGNRLAPCPSPTATNCDRSKIRSDFNEMTGNDCQGSGSINFTSPPMRLEDISIIQPLGLMIGDHVTPIDHQYYYPKSWVSEPTVESLKDVLAPGDAIITSIQAMPTFFSHVNGKPGLGDYRIILEIKQEVLQVLIIKVGHRRNVYD